MENIFDKKGINVKRILYIPVKDKNGIQKDKFLRISEGGEIHKKLLGAGTKLPNCWIVEQ